MNYMTTKSYRPANMINDMDRMFNQLYSSKAPAHRGFNVDIAETPEVYRIEADLPGFAAEDVDVRVERKCLFGEHVPPAFTPRQTQRFRQGIKHFPIGLWQGWIVGGGPTPSRQLT